MQDRKGIKIKKGSTENGDFSYGGYKYRFCYDNYVSAEEKRARKLKNKGSRAYVASLVTVFTLCLLCMAFVICYDFGILTGDSAATPAFINICDGRKYDNREFGDFACESVSEEAVEKYHLPSGIVLTYVNAFPEYHYNDDKLVEGDIIVAVDDIGITCVEDFENFVTDKENGYHVVFDIYRKGEFISVDYVIN